MWIFSDSYSFIQLTIVSYNNLDEMMSVSVYVVLVADSLCAFVLQFRVVDSCYVVVFFMDTDE
jgi:hypothetical protein